jgi:hypothetical protein
MKISQTEKGVATAPNTFKARLEQGLNAGKP